MESLTFDLVSLTNLRRCARWHQGGEKWTGADWSNAMQGEAGEAGNVVKKLRHIETGLVGRNDPDRETLLAMLGDEIADTYLYLDLLADYYGVNIPDAIARKFNATSEREGFPERLPIQ